MNVRVTDMPALHVAFMRYVGPYGAGGISTLWERMVTWIAGHDLGPGPCMKVGVAYDDPSITAPERCRYDACVVVPRDFAPDRLVDVMDVAGGRYAIAEFVGTAHEIESVWDRSSRAGCRAAATSPTIGPATSSIAATRAWTGAASSAADSICR